MDSPIHTINALFQQLGLDHSNEAIDEFIKTYSPVPHNTPLYDATFWNPSQASFIKEALDDDADWAEVVDQLDSLLRKI